VLFAFDGTTMASAHNTNVRRIYTAYVDGDVEKKYYTGIGGNEQDHHSPDLLDSATGFSGVRIVERAFEDLDDYTNGPVVGNDSRLGRLDRLDIIGYSRGAALGLHFANRIWSGDGIPIRAGGPRSDNRGNAIRCGYKPIIRFVGLFDTVPSFGLGALNINGQGFNNLNLGWELDGDNMAIQWLAHATRDTDWRPFFNTHDIRVDATQSFDMNHGDIGFSPDTLRWMRDQMTARGIQLRP
jgi:hypothetical protein